MVHKEWQRTPLTQQTGALVVRFQKGLHGIDSLRRHPRQRTCELLDAHVPPNRHLLAEQFATAQARVKINSNALKITKACLIDVKYHPNP